MTHRRWRGIAGSLVILGVIVAVAALGRTSSAREVTSSLGIATHQQVFTALRFADPARLGQRGVRYEGKRVHDHLAFIVSNHGQTRRRYDWAVSFVPRFHVSRGSVIVGAGRSARAGADVLLPCNERIDGRPPPHRVQVRVSLRGSGEAIDFWQTCGG